MVCGGCGEIITDYIPDIAHDRRSFSPEGYMARARTGPTTSLAMHDQGLYTVMGGNQDSTGRMLPTGSRYKFNRLRVWDKRSKSRSTASLSKAFMIMNTVMGKLSIPFSVMERAAYIYRKAMAAGLTKGRTVAALAAAAMYVACRETGTPRTMDDLATAANVERKALYRDMRTLLVKLDIRPNQYKISSFLVKISNNLDIPENVKRDALDILSRSEKMRITTGKNPVAMAAAAIYVSCIKNGLSLSQRLLSKQAGISDVTIRNGVALMRSALDTP